MAWPLLQPAVVRLPVIVLIPLLSFAIPEASAEAQTVRRPKVAERKSRGPKARRSRAPSSRAPRTPRPARGAASKQSLRLDRYFSRFDRRRGPGAAVLVMKDGRVVHSRAYGMADISASRPIDRNTRFELASLSKQVTAMSVAVLAERGRLRLEDRVSKYLEVPSFARNVTIEQLLHHTSGLPEYLDQVARAERRGTSPPRATADVLAMLARTKKLRFAPGSKHVYNNTNYVLLALVVEKVTGRSFASFVHDDIFAPLRMDDSLVKDSPGAVANAAKAYARGKRGFVPTKEPGKDDYIVGDGGVYSTLADMERWAGAFDSGKLVGPAMLRKVFSPGATRDGKSVNYGFGWWFESFGNTPYAVHTGDWAGFKNVSAYVPSQRLWVTVLSNWADAAPKANLKEVLGTYLRQ